MPIQCTAEDPRPPRLPPRQPRRPRPASDEESSSEEDAGSWDAESNEYSSGGWEEAARPPTPDESTFAVPPPPAAAGPRTHAVQARLATAECTVEDLGARGEIATGICFLDHMIDQLQSHGQLGVALRCRVGDGPWARPNEPLGAAADEAVHIVGACGEALGRALRRVALRARTRPPDVDIVRFFCPLDEAYAECCLCLFPPVRASVGADVALEPYGTHAAGPRGREFVGTFRTRHTPVFWRAVARGMGALRRARALAGRQRAPRPRVGLQGLRALLPEGPGPARRRGARGAAGRGPHGTRRRVTKETSIDVEVDLDAAYAAADDAAGAEAAWDGAAKTPAQLEATIRALPRVATGVDGLDRLLDAFAAAAAVKVKVHCRGDRHIDDHHSAEDVAISLGQCLHEAVGDKAGLRRMAFATRRVGACEVRAVLDLSNRPHVTSDLRFDEEFLGDAAPGPGEVGRALTSEMAAHALESLALEARCTLHLACVADDGLPGHTANLALAAFGAFGAALGEAVEVDPRRRGGVASSKGTLSA